MRQSLALALLVVLAGCSSPLGGANPEPESVTPFSVTPEESTTTVRPGPATDDTGRFDAWLDAHWTALNDTTYAFRLDSSIRRDEQTFRNQSSTTIFGPDRVQFLERHVREAVTSRIWANETHVVSVRQEDNETTTEVLRADRRPDDRNRRLLDRLFELIVVETIEENASGYRVVGDLSPQARERVIPDDVTVQNVTVRLDVRDDGLIRSFHFGWSGTDDDGAPRWSRGTLSFDPSVERVPRPDWVDGVIGNTSVETPREPA